MLNASARWTVRNMLFELFSFSFSLSFLFDGLTKYLNEGKGGQYELRDNNGFAVQWEKLLDFSVTIAFDQIGFCISTFCDEMDFWLAIYFCFTATA